MIVGDTYFNYRNLYFLFAKCIIPHQIYIFPYRNLYMKTRAEVSTISNVVLNISVLEKSGQKITIPCLEHVLYVVFGSEVSVSGFLGIHCSNLDNSAPALVLSVWVVKHLPHNNKLADYSKTEYCQISKEAA